MKKSDKTRRLIVEKSASLFNQKGFAGTSIQDIMAATGLTKGGIYGNFKKESGDKKGVKEEIALAAFQYAVEVVNEEVRKRTFVIENSIDKLKAVVYFYKEHLFNPPVEGGCPILNTSVEADDNNPVLREKVLEALEYWQQRIIITLKYGIERGEVHPETELGHFARLFISTLEGGIMLSRIYKSPEPFDSVSRQLIKMIDEISV